MPPPSFAGAAAEISSRPEMAVLLTRPRADSERTARRLGGIDCLIWPLTEIVPTGAIADPPPEADGLVFTSAHAIRLIAEQGVPRGLPAFCVGPHTADAAAWAGFDDIRQGAGTAPDLVDLIVQSDLRQIHYLRGRDVSHDLAAGLAARGVGVSQTVLYAAEDGGAPESAVAEMLANGGIDLVTVWSRRAAGLLGRAIGAGTVRLSGGVSLLAISENAAVPLTGSGFSSIIKAQDPTGDAMIAAMRKFFAALRQ